MHRMKIALAFILTIFSYCSVAQLHTLNFNEDWYFAYTDRSGKSKPIKWYKANRHGKKNLCQKCPFSTDLSKRFAIEPVVSKVSIEFEDNISFKKILYTYTKGKSNLTLLLQMDNY